MNKHTYTKEQLDKMSRLELNMVVAAKLGIDYRFDRMEKIYKGIEGALVEFNPLENYNDCMMIIEKFKTYMIKSTSCGQHRVLFGGSAITQPTIQRAIVYCFLMMEV